MTERKYPIIIYPLSFSRKLYYEAYYNRGNHLYWKCHQRNPIILFWPKSWYYVDYCKNCGLGMCINCDLIDTPYPFDYEIFLG